MKHASVNMLYQVPKTYIKRNNLSKSILPNISKYWVSKLKKPFHNDMTSNWTFSVVPATGMIRKLTTLRSLPLLSPLDQLQCEGPGAAGWCDIWWEKMPIHRCLKVTKSTIIPSRYLCIAAKNGWYVSIVFRWKRVNLLVIRFGVWNLQYR